MSAPCPEKLHMKSMTIILSVLCLLLVLDNAVFAEPYLMLDASPATYLSAPEESIFATEPEFTLYALVNSDAPEWSESDLTRTFYLSAALVPDPGETDPMLGSYTFDDGATISTINVVGDMTYGTPPIEGYLKQNDLPSHGIFETYFYEHEFQLDPLQTTALYDSQVNPGGPDLSTDGPLYYQDFEVDISGLASGYALHFDLYTKGSDSIDKFAPFSHDLVTTPIPPSVIIGLIGMGVAGLKLRKYS